MAHGRVDAAQSLGGAEDYYGEAGRAPSTWVGRGAQRLGLSGPVSDRGLRRAFAGEHPLHGELLRARHGPQRNAAIDLTFSAPKSVSLLFGVGAPDVEGIEALAARFLDSDRVVALASSEERRWTALDARPIYAHAMAAGCLYQAVLRERLTAELGVRWGPVRDGLAELDGVPAEVLRVFSRRRVEIEAELARHGTRARRPRRPPPSRPVAGRMWTLTPRPCAETGSSAPQTWASTLRRSSGAAALRP
ncbi:MAG: relaxase domain-containing protein [Actinobacteria bacterium]|nr:relaxase domain-containing protein [Actinomycetota bacterium]